MLEQIFQSIFPLEMNFPIIFGMFMIMGVVGGLVATRVQWLPTISGFMLVGLLMGPQGINLITDDVIVQASHLVQISLGLILYKLGCSLHPEHVIKHPKIILVSISESLVTFSAVFLLLTLFGFSTIVSVLVAAIGISSSPAVLVHVASEMRAKGEVTENTKILVALNNLISFIVFSSALPFALYSSEATWSDILGIPFYRMIGGFAIGTVVAFAVTRLSRFLRPKTFHYVFPLMLGGIMLTLGLNSAFQMSFLFSCLVFGIMVRWFEKETHPITATDFGYAEDIFYIILFVTAGASLHVNEMVEAGWIAILFPFVRCAAKYLVLAGSARALDYNFKQASATGMLLMPMAGLAIGLLQTTNSLMPYIGAQVAILIFAAVAVLETIGPPIAKYAFRLSGEVDGGAVKALVVIPDDPAASSSEGTTPPMPHAASKNPD
ncbi:MAG TPA: peptidase [Alphaproteobacteria bacterium]|nr:peptidase [Alphaproteobacteria bacterium]